MSLIIDMLHESSHKYSQKSALRCKVAGQWVDYSYEAIWTASDRVAAGLAAWGLAPGEKVAILGKSSPAWVFAYLGSLKSNAIAVPIDKDLKQVELRHILADCEAVILFTEQVFLETISEIRPSLPALRQIVLLDQAAPGDTHHSRQAEQALVTVISEWRRLTRKYRMQETDVQAFEALAESYHELTMPGSTRRDETEKSLFRRILKDDNDTPMIPGDVEELDDFQKSSPPPPLIVKPSDPAVILYTSGTTGRSKGAMLSHHNIASNVRTAIELFDLDEGMHTLSFLPINHVFEQVAGIILPLATGGTISFAESLRKLGDNLAEVKPNFLLGVPAVFRLLTDRMTRKVESQRMLRACYAFPLTRPLVTRKIRDAFGGSPVFISGGAALDPAVASKLMDLGLKVYQGYGITETSPVIAVETPDCSRLGTVGKPIPGVDVRIHQPNAEGVGEIWTRGPNVMLGYYNNQSATHEVLTDGWYHTGDLGCIEDDGFLRICGRVKNLIVTANGKNVYPEEIENEILNSPFIAEIMVYGHKVDNTSEEVHALIYPDQEALDVYAEEHRTGPLSAQDVEDIIRREILERGRNLADYKRIKRFTLREDEFPKTTTRKIKRFVVEADIDTGQTGTGD